MKRSMLLIFSLGLGLCAIANPNYLASFEKKTPDIKAISAITFGPDGVLLVGDSINGAVYALDLQDRTPGSLPEEVQETDLDGTISALLGAPREEVMVHGMAINPISYNLYFSVSRGAMDWLHSYYLPNDMANAMILLRRTPQGQWSQVSLEGMPHQKQSIPSPVDADKKHRWKDGLTSRVDAITRILYKNGKVYVAGLSNEEFSSAFRMMPFPFNGESSMSTVEVFHGAHGKWETASPIRTFLPYELDGKDYILAAYLCTPFATFPMDQLKNGAHVKGKTLGEFGSGNYPLDMLEVKKQGKPYIMISNSNRTLMSLDVADIAAHNRKEGLSQKVKHKAGLEYQDKSGSQVMEMEPWGESAVVMLQRAWNGKLLLYNLPTDWLIR